MQSQQNSPEIDLRAISLLEYLSPFGVISTREFVLRLLSFVGLLFTSAISFPVLTPLVAYMKENGVQDATSIIYTMAAVLAFLMFWFLLSTLTKEYRTSGMPLPFIFALLSNVMPFIFILRFIFSSKAKRAINTERAQRQAVFRKNEKNKPKKSKIPDVDD